MSCGSPSLTVSSSKPSVIPVSAISFGGTYPNCMANLTISANVSGSSTITFTATQGSTSISKQFNLQITDCDPSATPFGGGSGISSYPYLVCSATHLQNMGINTGTLSSYYQLQSNIDLTSASMTPIGSNATPFTGTFDGNSFTLSNLTINLPTTSYVGLFADVSGVIKNLKLSNFAITGQNQIGTLTGQQESGSTLTNVTITGGTLTSTQDASHNHGGLVGLAYGTISGCTSSVAVSVTTPGSSLGQTGGLVGMLNGGAIVSSSSSGSVYGFSYVGGLVGYLTGTATITHSFATGGVSHTWNGFAYDAGGLVGQAAGTSSISSSYTSGANVAGAFNGQGGLVGTLAGSASVSNCYSQNTVVCGGGGNCFNFAGGLIGYLTSSNSTPVLNSYSSGSVSRIGGSGTIQGLVGSSSSANNLSTYWDTTTSLQATSANAGDTGAATAAMQTQATYVGWDFVNIWYPPVPGVSYPTLR